MSAPVSEWPAGIEEPATRAELERVAAWMGIDVDELERAVRAEEARVRS